MVYFGFIFSFPIVITFISFYQTHIEKNREKTFHFSSHNIFPVWGVMAYRLVSSTKFPIKLAWTLNEKNLLASLHCLYALYHWISEPLNWKSKSPDSFSTSKAQAESFSSASSSVGGAWFTRFLLLCQSQNFLNRYLNLYHNQN